MMLRTLLFALASLFSLWVGFFWFGEGSLHKVVIYLGYPSIFIAFAIFVWGLIELQRKQGLLKELLPRKRSAYIAIALVSGLLLLFETPEFKVVFDELILSVSAQYMHFDRLSGVPREANDYFSHYLLMDSILDKRPFFFPFLLSLVHDLSGYRIENAFILNGILTVFLITLVYIIGRLFSTHQGGLLAVCLAGTLPLLSIFASSGHFEMLNLVMISVVVVLSILYLQRPEEIRLIPLVFSLILLCQVRYENSLYLLPFGVLILLGWRKAGRAILSATVILSPLFLILYTMQFRMIRTAEHGFFQEGPNGRTDTFSLSYVSENLSSAVRYFFNASQYMSNSYLLSVIGISSVIGFLYWAWRKSKKLDGSDPVATTAFIFVLAIGLFSLVISVFNFGMFDRFITERLSLPIQLLFILLPPFVLWRLGRRFIVLVLLAGLGAAAMTYLQFDKKMILSNGILFVALLLAFLGGMLWLWKYSQRPRSGFILIPVIFILTAVMPIGHAHRYSQKYKSNDILMAEINFIRDRKEDEKMLFIAGHQYPAILTQTNSTFIDVLKAHPEVAKNHLQHKMYSSIYISRRFEKDEEGTLHVVKEEEWLDPNVFILEPVYVKHLTTQVILQIDRLVDVVLPENEGN